MKKSIYIALALVFMVTLPVVAIRYEGEVVQVNPGEQSLVLAKTNGQQVLLKLAKDAKLYYNNETATLAMYAPVTRDDFVSGYLETNSKGLVVTAHFFYLIREGTTEALMNGRLTLLDLESGICDTYELRKDIRVYLNNSLSSVTQLTKGMRVLVVLDYHFKVKKIAIFHYEYTGFIESLDLAKQTICINIGTRLTPRLREFRIGGTLTGICKDWETLALLMQDQPILYVKFSTSKQGNTITVLEIRSI